MPHWYVVNHPALAGKIAGNIVNTIHNEFQCIEGCIIVVKPEVPTLDIQPTTPMRGAFPFHICVYIYTPVYTCSSYGPSLVYLDQIPSSSDAKIWR